ncbi:negative regulation of cellular response to hepatocyte growth factor stimulus [Mactra antiquata]
MEVIKLVGLCLCYFLVQGYFECTAASNQGEFLKLLKDYEIVTPSYVTGSGHHIGYHLHPSHSIYKRSTKSVYGEPDLHFSVPINRNNHILKLYLNKNLISPGFVVERKGNKFKNVTDSQFSFIDERNKDCHFHGNIVNQSVSKVAVGLCNGMHGFIHTEHGEFFIEPLQNEQPSNDGQHRHVVYKRSALPEELDPATIHENIHKRETNDLTCGSTDFHQADLQRERWQRHHIKRRSSKHHRNKRSFSTERYVETLVVVDPSMIKYHKNEHLETYVLTVMNMVAAMFYDASIGNSINIVLVRILLMEQEQEELVITHHADKTLKSFCKYQKSINFKDDSHPNHHDVAVLLTRKNICSRLNEPCGTLGLAQVSGMCQPHRSCSINEDTGLALAYTVTHEIGHNFGMHHDSSSNGCPDPQGKQEYIMSPSLVADSLSKSWSNCSKQAITQFIDRDWGYCLDDEPSTHQFNYPVLPPGTMYDADHQCRLQYGTDNATICTNEQDVCANLWCRTDNKCSTHLEAAAEGTICGDNMWCFDGKCVKIGERPEAINGEWGQWTSWTECTRTCGGGVSNSQRHCDNPAPSHGGKYCLGERKRYRICNTEECQNTEVTFNQKQCEEFNFIPYKNRLYEWEHVPTSDTPCQLHCKPKNLFFSVLLKDIVTDGTPCTPGTRNMCLSGRCRLVGCDYVLDSKAREDRCGVCHGDGNTCTTVKSQFNESQGLGYVEAAVIPKGARNIRVEEVAAASNFLALQNSDGEYFLNGNWFIQWSGDYKAAGTTVQYTREGNKESVVSPGPLKEALHVMLLLQSSNPGVQFEYTVPKDNVSEPRQPVFQWTHQPWTHCTASCGTGSQRSEVICTELEAGIVDDKYCNISSKPDDIQRVCNEHLCPARWWKGPWQHCSVSCGENGVHQRTVICVRSLGADEQIALDDEACIAEEKPLETESCKKKEPCPGNSTWVVGEWSSCNGNPCGLQYRTIQCKDTNIGCENNEAPISEKSCTDIPCGEWKTTEWTKCTRPCGDGIQIRKAFCEGSEFCDTTNSPVLERSCNTFSCPHTSAQSTTEGSDDTHISEPTVTSEVDQDNTKVAINLTKTEALLNNETSSNASELETDVKDEMAATMEEDNEILPSTEIVEEEEQDGMLNEDDNDLKDVEILDISDIPDEDEVVTVTRRPGHKHRHHHGNLHIDKHTEHHYSKPVAVDSTDTVDEQITEPETKHDEQSKESEEIAENSDEKHDNVGHIESRKPSNEFPYLLPVLPPKQSLSDLPSVPNIDELPFLPDLKELPPLDSKELQKLSDLPDLPSLPSLGKPPTLPNTHLHHIPKELINTKSESDDEDIQTDNDKDNVNDDKEIIESDNKGLSQNIESDEIDSKEREHKVDSATLPPAEEYTHKATNEIKDDTVQDNDRVDTDKIPLKDFNPALDMMSNLTLKKLEKGMPELIKEMPKFDKDMPDVNSMIKLKTEHDGYSYMWKPLDWSDCSRNCGGGVRTRVVECLNIDVDTTVQQDLCNINTKPTAIDECNKFPCSKWLTTSWGECSAPCGHSVRHRMVTCEQNGMCDPKVEPASEEVCDVPKCVKWVSGQWSQCNKKCDGGEQLRLVQCIDMSTQLRAQGCEYSEKPDEVRECNLDPCNDNNAALSLRCEFNEISSKLCRALKKMGQCSNRFVSLKCCKTCSAEAHKEANKDRPRKSSLR